MKDPSVSVALRCSPILVTYTLEKQGHVTSHLDTHLPHWTRHPLGAAATRPLPLLVRGRLQYRLCRCLSSAFRGLNSTPIPRTKVNPKLIQCTAYVLLDGMSGHSHLFGDLPIRSV